MRILAIVSTTALVLLCGALAFGFYSGNLVVATGSGTAADRASGPQRTAAVGASPAAAPGGSATDGLRTTDAQARPEVTAEQAYGDWVYRCLKEPGGDGQTCSISQRIAREADKRTIFSWRIMQDGKGGLVSVWQVPSGVLLSRGLELDTGLDKPIVVPFQSCGNSRCQAVAGLAPEFVETLSGLKTVSAKVYLQDGKAVDMPLSADGLAAALGAISGKAG